VLEQKLCYCRIAGIAVSLLIMEHLTSVHHSYPGSYYL